jgi:YYY domain-containing protein
MIPFSEIMAAARWWLVLFILGLAALPLAYTLLARLPDRGYAFTKMLGLLLVTYLFWLLGSLGFLANSLGGILFALGLVTAVSLIVYLQARPGSLAAGEPTLSQWLRRHGRYVLLTELVFAAIFVLWVWARSQNPAILHTEKPMEFAFLNGVSRSPLFPPLDPWLSGYAISYYYFGYVMTSVLARLAAVPEAIAFNLAVAWLTAGTAVGAFGLVYNLIAAGETDTAVAEDKPAESAIERRRRRRAGQPFLSTVKQQAVFFGLLAALALPLAGNLQMLMEVLHANRIGSTQFWTWLDVRDINQEPPAVGAPPRYTDAHWWWWRSSRVINEHHLSGRSEAGLEPIAEFPAFSFMLGDLHPHVMALPFAFLSLALALAWARGAANFDLGGMLRGDRKWPFIKNRRLLLLTAVVLGGLSFLNTWDVLIHLFVVVGAFVLARWQAAGEWRNEFLGQALALGFVLALLAGLFYLPFYLGFRSQAGAPFLLPMFMRPTRLPHFLIIFGMSLWAVLFLLLGLAARQRLRHWQTGLQVAAGLILALFLLALLMGLIVAAGAQGFNPVVALAAELDLALPGLPPEPTVWNRLGWGLVSIGRLLPMLLAARLQFPGMTLLLAAVIGLAVMILMEKQAERATARRSEVESVAGDASFVAGRSSFVAANGLPFALLLVVTGALLTLGPEFVYLRDNFGMRLNTIFKFYYQAWVMFGVAALFALHYLWRHWRPLGMVVTSGYLALLMVALLFPIHAVSSRGIEYRGRPDAEQREPATLDGLAYLSRYSPDDHAAILWLRENVTGTPVILEAVGTSYSLYGRVSANTGLPTLLGWPGHQGQWRGQTFPEPGRREPAVRTIYSQPDWQQVIDLLNQYEVAYIYVGPLEYNTYGPQGLAKFNELLPVAYSNSSVTIYRWQP